MKNREKWRPSKYVFTKGKLRASRDPNEVGVSSRLMADLVAACYERQLASHASGRLLDLGCGKVPLFEAYRPHVTENICVDWGNSMHRNEYLDRECDLTQDLPFGEGEFDTVVLSDVLEHLPEPERLWREIYRVLAPKGRLIMNVPFYYSIHEAPHDFYRYTEFALKRFAERAGFSVLCLERVGGAPEIMADITAKNIRRVPHIGNFLAGMVQSVVGWFVGTGIGRRISESSAESFPFGYFLVAERPGVAAS